MPGKILGENLERWRWAENGWPPLPPRSERYGLPDLHVTSCMLLTKAEADWRVHDKEPDWPFLWAYVPDDCVRLLGKAFKMWFLSRAYTLALWVEDDAARWAMQAKLLARKPGPCPLWKTSWFGTQLIREARKRGWLK